jgi:hypothetical protein
MVKKKEMTAAVSELKKQMSEIPEESSPEKVDNENGSSQEQPEEPIEETSGDHDLQLKDVEHLLEEHGVDVDELKGLWKQFLNELKDLPTKKPLVTVFGAFLLGYLAGRMSKR